MKKLFYVTALSLLCSNYTHTEIDPDVYTLIRKGKENEIYEYFQFNQINKSEKSALIQTIDNLISHYEKQAKNPSKVELSIGISCLLASGGITLKQLYNTLVCNSNVETEANEGSTETKSPEHDNNTPDKEEEKESKDAEGFDYQDIIPDLSNEPNKEASDSQEPTPSDSNSEKDNTEENNNNTAETQSLKDSTKAFASNLVNKLRANNPIVQASTLLAVGSAVTYDALTNKRSKNNIEKLKTIRKLIEEAETSEEFLNAFEHVTKDAQQSQDNEESTEEEQQENSQELTQDEELQEEQEEVIAE